MLALALQTGMYCAPYPFRNVLLAGPRRCLNCLRVLCGKPNLDYTAHCFPFGKLGPSHLSFLLAQGF